MTSHRLGRVALTFAAIAMLGQARPVRLAAQPVGFGVGSESTRVPVQADRVDIEAAPRVAAATIAAAGVGSGLPRLGHAVLPPDLYARLKAAASRNFAAPVDTLVRPAFDSRIGALTPAPLVKFAGLVNLDRQQPPDMALAVSPNWVVQAVNNHIVVRSRTGVVQSGWPKTSVAFFGVPSPGACDPKPFMSDPRAFYAPREQRFVVAWLQVDGPPIGSTCALLSKYWIAVSKTSDPRAGFHVYAFDMKGTTSDWADYTQLGYDANGIYFSGNLFSATSGTFASAKICGAPKAKMESGLAVTAHCFTNLKAGGALVDTVQPVESLTQAASGTTAEPVEYFVDSNNGNCTRTSCSGVTVWAFSNVLASAPSLSAVNVATKSYAFPPSATEPGGRAVDTGDERISGTPTFQGGLVSFGLDTAIAQGTSTVAGIFWGQIKPALSGTTVVGGSVLQSGYISFTGRSAYYPALVPDSRGDLFVGFGSSSPSLNPSAYYAARTVSSTPGTFGTAVGLAGGASTYTGTRWGDFSALAVDGTTTTSDVWMALEFATTKGDWATEVGATRLP